jgi:hypothetical protein
MAQACKRTRFVLEALAPGRVVGDVPRQHLDGHRSAEPRVGRTIHLTHPAGTDRRDDFIRSEAIAWC